MKFQVSHSGSKDVIFSGEVTTEIAKDVTAHVKTILSKMVDEGKADANAQFRVAVLNNADKIHDVYTLRAGNKAQRKPPKAAPAAKVA